MRLPYYVIRGAQSRYTIGVAAVVRDRAGNFLLVEHTYHPRFPWGLPGGWADADEDPAAAALRELKEELALDARILRILCVARTATSHIDLAYLCQACGPIGQLSHELLGYRWVKREDLPALKPFHRRAIAAALEQEPKDPPWAKV